MTTEYLTIFNEFHEPIGTASREEVHRMGHWHETFHCWFLTEQNGTRIVTLQRRSAQKKDYPNLYDITAAGHLTSSETVQDGIREIAEEIGIEVAYNDLVPLGIIPYSIVQEHMIDNEFAHVFVCSTPVQLEEFRVQPEEVGGISQVEFEDFKELWLSDKPTIDSVGFIVSHNENTEPSQQKLAKVDFVPHPHAYYETVIQGMLEMLNKTNLQ